MFRVLLFFVGVKVVKPAFSALLSSPEVALITDDIKFSSDLVPLVAVEFLPL